MDFDTFSFDQRIRAGIRDAGYTRPTPIQERAIPDVLAGKDVLGLAQTGTGKTAAFALPLLQRLLDADAPKRGPVRVLVLAPTRELALQIHESFVELGRQTGIRSAAVFGGVGVTPQVKALAKATVAVACPGRLLDLMNRGEADMSGVDCLVLDEADRMLDMGFLHDVRKILKRLPRERQNLLFSATMPREINDLASGILRDPVTVQVANTAPAKRINHVFCPVAKHLKASLLESVLRETDYDSVLVFTRTKHKAKAVAQKLSRKGWQATFLQGNLSQSRRQEALDGFRNGKYSIMVATDIAARGIDCERITHVINMDIPDTAETYTHRIGRTGRAGRSGMALTFITDEDNQMVRAIERTLGYEIERQYLDGFDYDVAPKAQPEPAAARPGGKVPANRGGRGAGRGGARASGNGAGKAAAKPAPKSAAKPAAKSGNRAEAQGEGERRPQQRRRRPSRPKAN